MLKNNIRPFNIRFFAVKDIISYQVKKNRVIEDGIEYKTI